MTAGSRPPLRFGDRIDDGQESEPIEVRITSVDGTEPVFTHEDGGASVEEDVSSQVKELTVTPP